MFLKEEEAEITFANDDSDVPVELDLKYEENYWHKDDDEPTGYTYKGKKKIFVKAVENIRTIMKKGVQKRMENLQFRILDCRKASELDVEISKGKERGIAVLKIFGPNSRKECTLMINKSRKHEAKL